MGDDGDDDDEPDDDDDDFMDDDDMDERISAIRSRAGSDVSTRGDDSFPDPDEWDSEVIILGRRRYPVSSDTARNRLNVPRARTAVFREIRENLARAGIRGGPVNRRRQQPSANYINKDKQNPPK